MILIYFLHNLKFLNCDENQIELLDLLPKNLIKLSCNKCKIKNLDSLPRDLEILIANHNNLELNFNLDSLKMIRCDWLIKN